MKNFSEWIGEVLNNDKLLRDIRTGVSITVASLLALIYWGFIENFNWSGVEITKVVGLTVVFTVSVFIVRIEFKQRAFTQEREDNKELADLEQVLFNEDVNIQHDALGIEWVAEFNRKGQEKANRIKTESRVMKLQEKRRDRLRKNKPVSDIDLELERLKTEYLIDTRYKPVRYTDLISTSADWENKKDVIDRDQIYYDPVRQGNVRGFASTFMRSLVPGSLGIGFLLQEPLLNIVLYYVFLLIAFAWTISTQYVLTRKNTATRYFMTRKNKLTLLREMKLYIQQKLTETQEPKEETKII